MRKKLLLGGFLCLGLLRVSYAMTVSDILSRARYFLKDQSASASRQQFTDAVLETYVSDGQREANAYAWLLQQRTSITLVPGTTEYSLPTNFMAMQRVIYKKGSNSWIKLDQTSFNQLDADSSGWMSISSGTPTRYYVYLTTAPVIGFVPCPNSASTGTVQMDYVITSNDVTTTTETPFNGFAILAPYHSALAYYVVCRAYKQVEEYELAQPFCDEWTQSIATMRSGLLKQPDFNPGFSGRRNQ